MDRVRLAGAALVTKLNRPPLGAALVLLLAVCVALAFQLLRWQYRLSSSELIRIDRLTGNVEFWEDTHWHNPALWARREAQAKKRIGDLLRAARRKYGDKYADYLGCLDRLWARADADAQTRARRIANDINYWRSLRPEQRREVERMDVLERKYGADRAARIRIYAEELKKSEPDPRRRAAVLSDLLDQLDAKMAAKAAKPDVAEYGYPSDDAWREAMMAARKRLEEREP